MRYQIRLAPLRCAPALPAADHASSPSVPDLDRKTPAGTVALELRDAIEDMPGHRSGFTVRANSSEQTSNSLNER